ncbi:hypothetical protein B0H11DRAFT_1927001 [Mycena galericulata]|nr:hypothetical protein B0H11DRAFT_1927001 [Mycena galericulata]
MGLVFLKSSSTSLFPFGSFPGLDLAQEPPRPVNGYHDLSWRWPWSVYKGGKRFSMPAIRFPSSASLDGSQCALRYRSWLVTDSRPSSSRVIMLPDAILSVWRAWLVGERGERGDVRRDLRGYGRESSQMSRSSLVAPVAGVAG